MAIIGYVTHGAINPDILDVGCGHGRLPALLARFGFGHYLGIDLSPAAIESATSLGIPAAEFEVADFEVWDTPRRFDIVIFNESLYFAHQPAEMVEQSLRWLNDNGLVVVSMYRHGDVRRIWKAVDSAPGIRVLDATTVRNLNREVWDIKALQPTR
jgi:SAM-dependent methyltransferase